MLTVGVRELRNKLSQYLKQVRGGERIEVTDRGAVVALLLPVPNGDPTRQTLLGLAEKGVVSWSGGKPRGSEPLIEIKGRPLSETVLEDRR